MDELDQYGVLLALFVGTLGAFVAIMFRLDRRTARRTAQTVLEQLPNQSPGKDRAGYITNQLLGINKEVTINSAYAGALLLFPIGFWGVQMDIFWQVVASWLTVMGIGLGMHSEFTIRRVRRKAFEKIWAEGKSRCSESEVQDVLQAGWQSQRDALMQQAIDGHLEWRSPQSELALKSLLYKIKNVPFDRGGKQENRIRNENKHFRQLQERFRSHQPATLMPILVRSLFWRRVAAAALQPGPEEINRLLSFEDKSRRTLILFFKKLHELGPSFPHLYCGHCHRWAQRVKMEDVLLVRCPECETQDDLMPNVQAVIGRVGEAPKDDWNGNHLYLSLWNERQKKVYPAEISRLEVVPKAGVDFDWALVALVEKLRNFLPENYPRIPLGLSEEFDLDPNTFRVLNDFFELDPHFQPQTSPEP